MSSAAVVIGALRVNKLQHECIVPLVVLEHCDNEQNQT